jgi:hypothetical protein
VSVDWIHLAQNRDQWRALATLETSLPKCAGRNVHPEFVTGKMGGADPEAMHTFGLTSNTIL